MTKAERYTWLAACKALAADGGPVNSDVLRLCLADIAALEAQLARIPEELLGKQGDELIAWFQSMSVQLAQRDERIRKITELLREELPFLCNCPWEHHDNMSAIRHCDATPYLAWLNNV